jgi:hypothetical protein
MSGTGKSSVVRELVARGYKAVDTGDGWGIDSRGGGTTRTERPRRRDVVAPVLRIVGV